MSPRGVFWAGAGAALAAVLLDRAVQTWLYRWIEITTAVAVYTVAGTVLSVVAMVGAVVAGGALLLPVLRRTVGAERALGDRPGAVAAEGAPGGAGGADPSGGGLGAELLPPRDGAEPLAGGPDADGPGEPAPVYRVDFAGLWGGTERYRLTGARDVREVLGWAQAQAEGRGYDVGVERPGGDDAGLVPLLRAPAGG